jgi:transcriptional regulator with XRE-family HTH domain
MRSSLLYVATRMKGSTMQFSDAWIKAAKARMAEKGWNQARLADEAKVPESMVSRLLNKRQGGSKGADQIARALGLPAPSRAVSPLESAILDVMQIIEKEDPKAFAEEVTRLMMKRESLRKK